MELITRIHCAQLFTVNLYCLLVHTADFSTFLFEIKCCGTRGKHFYSFDHCNTWVRSLYNALFEILKTLHLFVSSTLFVRLVHLCVCIGISYKQVYILQVPTAQCHVQKKLNKCFHNGRRAQFLIYGHLQCERTHTHTHNTCCLSPKYYNEINMPCLVNLTVVQFNVQQENHQTIDTYVHILILVG